MKIRLRVKVMNNKPLTLLAAALLLMLTVSTSKVFAATTVIFIDPPEVEVPEPGTEFTVKVKIQNAENIVMWQIALRFNPGILECLNVSIPDDNFFAGKDIIAPEPNVTEYNSMGIILYGVAVFPLVGVSGNGTLCEIQFKGIAAGVSPLEFLLNPPYRTLLEDPYGEEPPFEKVDGSVTVIPENFAIIALATFSLTTMMVLFKKGRYLRHIKKAR